MISARYWRLLAADVSWNQTWGPYHWNLYEAYLYTSADCSGTRLPVSASAASTTYSTYYASNAQDGNASTFWAAVQPQYSPQWISFDSGSGNAFAVGSISLIVSANSQGMINPKKIHVQYGPNGTDWTTLVTADVANANTNMTTRQILDIQAAAVGRLLIHGGLMSRPPQFGGRLMRN